MSDYVELSPGMPLWMSHPDGSSTASYTSAVRRVDERGILIDVPRRGQADLALSAGDEVMIRTQSLGRLYEFGTRVGEAAGSEVLLEHPPEAVRREQRDFNRLLISLPTQVELLLPDEAAEERGARAEDQPMEATIVDLSGGGVLLRVDEVLPLGSRLRLTFEPDGEPMTVEVELLGVEYGDGRRSPELRCWFTVIERHDLERLVRFIFLKQREYVRREVA